MTETKKKFDLNWRSRWAMLRLMLLIRKIRVDIGIPTQGRIDWLWFTFPMWWKGEKLEGVKTYTWEQLEGFERKTHD